jgi:hypothetical protein
MFMGSFDWKEINPLDVLNCQHPAVNGLQSILMDACDLQRFKQWQICLV